MGGNTDAGIKQLPDGNRGWIWDIKKYALHDGPGIRTTVFFSRVALCVACGVAIPSPRALTLK